MKKYLPSFSVHSFHKGVRPKERGSAQVSKPQRISEAVLVAIATALSYAVAYAYQAGFASFFELPPLLLTPTIGTILQAAAAVGAILLAFWNVASGVWQFAPRGDTALVRAIRRFLVVTLFVGFFFVPIRDVTGIWVIAAIILGVYAFFSFVFPLITQRKIPGYENKLLGQEKIEHDADRHSLRAYAARTLGESELRLIAMCVLLVYFSYLVGLGAAIRKEEFLVLDDRPGFVVAAIDNELLVLAEYNPATRALTGKYQVERLSEDDSWILKRIHIGKLGMMKKKAA